MSKSGVSKPAKGQRVNILSFQAHMVSATAPLYGRRAATENKSTHACGWLPTRLYLWTLELEFHRIFVCHKILFIYFFQLFKNVKTTVSWWAVWKHTEGQIWLMGYRLLGPGLDTGRNVVIFLKQLCTGAGGVEGNMFHSQNSVTSVRCESQASAEVGVGLNCQRQRILEKMRKLFYRNNTVACRAEWKSHRSMTVSTDGKDWGFWRLWYGSWVFKDGPRLWIHLKVGSSIKVWRDQEEVIICYNMAVYKWQ